MGGGVHERLVGGFRRGFEVSGGAGWFQEDCVVSGEAVWFQDRRGFRKGCVAVWLQAGWRFQERLGGFRKGCVVSGKAGVFHEKLAGGFRKGLAVSGNGCGKDWVVSRIRQQPFQK